MVIDGLQWLLVGDYLVVSDVLPLLVVWRLSIGNHGNNGITKEVGFSPCGITVYAMKEHQ